jgi:hypothetical protein
VKIKWMGLLLSSALVLLLFAGCQASSEDKVNSQEASAAAPTPQPIAEAASESAGITKEQPSPSPQASAAPVKLPGKQLVFEPLMPDTENKQLFHNLGLELAEELSLAQKDWEEYLGKGRAKLFRGSLGFLPEDLDFHVAVATDSSNEDSSWRLYLYGVSKDYSRVLLLGKAVNDPFINLAKFDLTSKGNQLHLWSQWPFRAAELQTDLEWDGSELKVLRSDDADPTAEYYEQLEAFLQKEDLEGLIQHIQDYAPFYPHQYEGFYVTPKPILLLTHKKALDAYQSGDAEKAKDYMEFGLDQYESVFLQRELTSLTMEDLEKKEEDPWAAEKVNKQELILFLNDYAFFLSEAGDDSAAEPLLRRVIALDPKRTVAYINLGDVCWNLNKQSEARTYYITYMDLLGDNKSKAPQRVIDRINNSN